MDVALGSINKYISKTTVIGVEKDYMFWNTSIPSMTLCPTENRLDEIEVRKYCKDHGVSEALLIECEIFMESLANASYRNLKNIKDFKDVDVSCFY